MQPKAQGDAREIIDQLGLLPHPEGGWYRETWRAEATEASHGWALVSCIVSPAFEFAGFELAEPDWSPGG